ncbi:cytochrome c4 [Bradyrhizobium manausense]|uniref:c-type cytochrome n=1 Tax=Bradyrhizobium TaxID=374 RepID=UPI001BA73C9D|nr:MULTISPECIES: c-type cytochrome [Bradyrhizobium]MBR0829778.1 cytochrome c4 [Bradyrhizobium manausense]UVO25389.1 cytochrome c4 [Bradyrhizobium arachidis]
MSAHELFSFRNPHFKAGVGITVALFILTALVGFIVLPFAQPWIEFSSVWEAICSAAGVPQRAATTAPASTHRLSNVVLTSSTLTRPSQESIGRGATLAQRCAICHGPTGISRADSPNLAGQYAAVIYKQLLDFRSGARTNAVMSPFAVNLTDQEIADISAYYAYLPRLPAYHPTPQLPKPNIVIYGAPIRGIAPCGSCHGSLDNKTGSPWLEGQSEVYLKAQLIAFATGERRNDISQQMRNIARAMTPQEIDAAAAYYASQPPDIVKAVD